MEDQNGDSESLEGQFITPIKSNTIKKGLKKSINKSTKARTPSGQVINTSVKDIRNFFTEKVVPQSPFQFDAQPTVKFVNKPIDYQHVFDEEWELVKGAKACKAKPTLFDQVEPCKQQLKHPAWRLGNRFAHLKEDQSSIDSESDYEESLKNKDGILDKGDEHIDVIRDRCEQAVENLNSNRRIGSNSCSTMADAEIDNAPEAADNKKAGNYSSIVQMVKEMAQNESHVGGDDEHEQLPGLIDARTVVKMFNSLQIKLDNTRVDEIARDKKEQEEQKLLRELAKYKRKYEVMSGVVGHLGNIINEMDKKMDSMEMRSMRRHSVIYGLETTGRITQCIKQVEKFLTESLQIEITIIDGFKLGVGNDKPMVFLVDSIVSRATIFQAMEKYKKDWLKNEKTQGIFITDYIPAEMKEQKRKEKEIFRLNESDRGVNMSIEKSGLKINGSNYKPIISPPDPTKVLSYTEAQLDSIYDMEPVAGEKITQDGSVFISYMIPVNAHLAIDNAYMKLRLKYPHAKSIMLGYSIPGMPRFSHEEYCDDKEVGGGKVIMNLIKRNRLCNIAIFVVRIHKNSNIGVKRFDCIRQAVLKVMEPKPFNKYTNSRQSITEESWPNNTLNSEKQGVRPIRQRIRGGRAQMTGLRPVNGDDEYTGNKRRRRYSPTTHGKNYGNDFSFDDQQYFNYSTMPTACAAANSNLGSSWPSLQQSMEK